MQNLRLCGTTRHRQSYRDRPTAAFRHILGRASEKSEQPTGCGRIPTKDKLPWAPCDPARPDPVGVIECLAARGRSHLGQSVLFGDLLIQLVQSYRQGYFAEDANSAR